jgi:glutamate-1-semialdehyde 2,1-aminomutase
MAQFDRLAVAEEDFVFQIGTLSGNPVAAVAGLITLEVLRRPGTYEKIFATGRELMGALTEMLRSAGIKAQVIGEPPLFDVVFTDKPIRNYRDGLQADAGMAKRFNELLRANGIMKGNSKYYVSLAHTREDVAHTIGAWREAIRGLKTA